MRRAPSIFEKIPVVSPAAPGESFKTPLEKTQTLELDIRAVEEKFKNTQSIPSHYASAIALHIESAKNCLANLHKALEYDHDYEPEDINLFYNTGQKFIKQAKDLIQKTSAQ